MYAPYLNQFIQPDTIVPDPYIPADWHKYTYVRNNPINFTDPSGHISCTDSNDPICIAKVQQLKSHGLSIKEAVRTGGQLPVEGFAQYADYAWQLFDNDIRGTMWAITLTVDGMDANKGAVWSQVNIPHQTYWLGFDWLPYQKIYLFTQS